MNIIRLCGGLGNQLFQYAFGKAMSVYHPVKYDTSWYEKSQHANRPYRLDVFPINIETVSGAGKLKRHIEKDFDMSVLHKSNRCFCGYWQSPLYFEHLLNELKEELNVKPELYTPEYLALKEKILSTNSVSIHVRRGDYLLGNHRVIDMPYYNKALRILETLTETSLDLYIFSDDIEWCKRKFPSGTFINNIDYLDFELMKLCKHHIIANSSYSIWSAYLNEEGHVIAPFTWGGPFGLVQHKMINNQMILPQWIVV